MAKGGHICFLLNNYMPLLNRSREHRDSCNKLHLVFPFFMIVDIYIIKLVVNR